MEKLNIEMLQALNGERKLKIIRLLAEEGREMTAPEMIKKFNLKGAYIYQVLPLLCKAGWITKVRYEKEDRYKLTDIEEISKKLFGGQK